MHNNYFFLRHLTAELNTTLAESTLLECFSQEKDELIVVFEKKNKEHFYLQAHLSSHFSCLNFPREYHRARRNTASLFPELENNKVASLVQAANERAFTIHFLDSRYSLVFKLYGNRSNIILFDADKPVHLFKKSLSQDWELPLLLGKPVDLSIENLISHEGSIKKVIFTLGDLGEKYLLQQGYQVATFDIKYQLLQDLNEYLKNPSLLIIEIEKKIFLSLFPIGKVLEEFTSPIHCISKFFSYHFRYNLLEGNKANLRKLLSDQARQLKGSIEKSATRLQSISSNMPPEKVADIIMANLHAIPSGASTVQLFNFYEDNQIEVKLKKDLTPQKNAELLYRKGKNRHIEVENLKLYLQSKSKDLENLQKDLIEIEAIESYKLLDPYSKKYLQKKKTEKEDAFANFKSCDFAGFKILVGKNADNNDELTQKFAHKDDLWLHAKDVTGSHVIIKHQPGKNFPKNVIEKAAALAAFYSKRKTDSLCPVQYTLKKYVRKVKGAPKGQVKVERESVIMVVPRDF